MNANSEQSRMPKAAFSGRADDATCSSRLIGLTYKTRVFYGVEEHSSFRLLQLPQSCKTKATQAIEFTVGHLDRRSDRSDSIANG